MTNEREYQESIESSRDIASAWIVFAALLLGVTVFSAVDFIWPEQAGTIARDEGQPYSLQMQPGRADRPR